MSTAQLRPCFNPEVYMAKKKSNEVQLLELLKKILPKATDDPKLAQKIFSAVELELKAKPAALPSRSFANASNCPI